MANFSALKTAIQNAIKQNGNEEITGDVLQQILLSMVSTMGDGAINTIEQNLSNETTTRQGADTQLQNAINAIKNNIDNGYVYAGIATPSSTPVSGKVFYIATAAGTYTNFGGQVLTQGINILRFNGSAWSSQQLISIDSVPTAGSNNLVKSGGVQNELALGAVYDVSAKNPTAGPNNDGKWESLSALLSDADLNTLIPTAYRKGGMSIKFVHSSDNKYIQARCMAQNFTTDVTQWQGIDDEPTVGSENLVKSGGVAALVGVPLLDNTSRARYDILFTDSDVEVGDVLVHNFASGMIAYYDSNNSVITYIGSNSGATVDSSYTITSAFSYAKVASVGGITSATIINTKVDSCRELTKKVKDIEDSVDGLESSISDIEDDVENIGNELSEIRSERVINEYPTTQGANYDTIGNTHIYFLTNPIEKGEIVSGVSLYSKGAGTIHLYFCSLDFNSNKAYLIEKKDVTCVLGDNAIEFTNPFEATGKTFIGIKGQNLIGYKNTSSGDWGTINYPLYEATTDITPEGTSITVGATTYFRYPVSLKASYVAYVTKEEAEGFATKEELQELSISCTLDNGNMLRYHKEDNGEYTLWGRWFDLTVNGTVRKVTNNAGSEIMFAVEGATSVVFTFDQITPNTINPYMAFSIDGGDFTRQQLETDGSFYTTTLVLSDAGEHIVRMSVDAISQTDHAYKWNGTNAFALVSITPNAGTMTAIKPMNKIGMFFGDSVTEGINVLGTGDTNTVQSAIEAYSYWTARYLNSVRYCIGYGGSGMTQAGSFKPCIDAVNYYKNGVPTGDFYPDYIVINHGINDYSGTVEAFITAYTAVIERLRVKYPGVTIFMVYPFMTNSANNKFVSGMETLANSYSNVYFVPTLGWNGETTDGTHLSVAGAKSNAEKLSKEIIKILGKSFFI